jgi:AraC-like DNA-binding protein
MNDERRTDDQAHHRHQQNEVLGDHADCAASRRQEKGGAIVGSPRPGYRLVPANRRSRCATVRVPEGPGSSSKKEARPIKTGFTCRCILRGVTKRPRTMSALEAETLSGAEAQAALDFIEAHLYEPMSVKTIAASCGVSAFRFSRQFTQRQGESVMAYVRGRRLESAMRRLLVDRDVSLTDLAFDSGFDSQEALHANDHGGDGTTVAPLHVPHGIRRAARRQ